MTSFFLDAEAFDRELDRKRFREEVARIELANADRAERDDMRTRLRLIAAYCRHRETEWARDILRLAEEGRAP